MKIAESASPQLVELERVFREWAADLPNWLPQAIEEARRNAPRRPVEPR